MPSRQELAAPSSAPTPAPAPAPAPSNKKKPKKITGPPPHSEPFKRPYHVSKDRPMSWYRGDANRIFLWSPFSKAFPLLLLDKLPKLQPRPISDDDEPIAVNGFDATKKHFYAAQAKWERAVEIMEEEGRRMVYYGRTMHEEAQACHKWVGQVGKMTWEGHHGRMKNYDAFEEALDKVCKMNKKAVETVEEVQESTKKWPVDLYARGGLGRKKRKTRPTTMKRTESKRWLLCSFLGFKVTTS
ncbi:hypothetical protein GE21DRAFT_3597 [Neurospora crassa]|uniref:Uncharacterized protein n=2 Tax=Neurospora crassa TaxID=5141 RepID=Q1K8V4_NEUCR|nr:hypothetical protein NCU08724 [Neurospora crassa OR74A]EAA34349.1 hypothetical protein NCU08724 [Neurospora crassa OR74A]KHE82898.1 hypothetical protein GE21DRAFT_3597 [Neurospora crassa]CAB99370.1 hypothetical protein [Neurospora crassa]|eukprot:XP_963585.1 hypothetical protein NCU08724 [Neurospora crassa OR74A]